VFLRDAREDLGKLGGVAEVDLHVQGRRSRGGRPHFRKCFDDVLGRRASTKLLRRVQFHYTPKLGARCLHPGQDLQACAFVASGNQSPVCCPSDGAAER
jgi:hypothetical protein